jgi:type I restriction enzyme, S subunit
MASDSWREMTLGEFVRLQRGHDLPETDRRHGMVPIMGSAGHNGFHDTAKAKGPGVVIGRSGVGSMGVVTYCATDYWPHNTVLYVTDFLGNDERFTYYFLRHLNLRRFDSGSAQASLNRNYIYPIRIRVPNTTEQCAIAHLLGTLDDKIALNRWMNETLEAMAQVLFKSWFVDFAPVRAKAEGRDPGLPQLLADLFPDRFEDSELGEIPAGWKVGRLEDVLVLQRGFDLPATARTSGPYPVTAASGPNGMHNQFMVRGPGVTTGRSGVLGNVFYVHEDFWPLNTSLWVKEFKHSTPVYAFHLLRRLDFGAFNAGSAVPTLNRNHVHNLPILMPPLDLILAFDTTVVPMMNRQKASAQESLALTALRDTLLPKLISGELRVKDAERFIGRAS